VHIIVKASPPHTGKRGQVEVYDRGRYFCFTGAILYRLDSIEERQEQVATFCAVHWPASPPSTAPATPRRQYSDTEQVEWARGLLKRLAPWRCDEYDKEAWYGVGMALCELGEIGLDLWDAWSQQSAKYPGREELARKWATFKPHAPGGLSLGSLYKWATEDDPTGGNGHRPGAAIGATVVGGQAQRLPASADLTDLANAQRLVKLHGSDLRYCYPWACWLVWTGQRWQEDKAGEIMRRAKQTAQAIYAEAAAASDPEHAKALGDHARRSLSDSKLNAMIALAQSEPGIPVLPEQLDLDPWLLNCQNGTLDLRTGELRPHRRDDLITKLAPVNYNPHATSPTWARVLSEATGEDKAMIAFLARAVGYSLTGNTGEEVLFFVHGPAATGKSTFVEAVKATLGDYAKTADFEAFLRRRDVGMPRPDIARLAGARFVASIEVDEGKRMAEGLIKVLTGGDTVTARRLYSAEFEFRPAMKLWLAANHAPKVSDEDSAMWRRILRVPFVHEVPKDKRDPKIKAELCDPARSGAAILAWAVAGALDWQNGGGLKVPATVTEATDAYKADMDPLREFFDTCCAFDKPQAWTSAAALRNAYEKWAKDTGERDLVGGREWGDRLRAKGLTEKRKAKARGWLGLYLTEAEVIEETLNDDAM